MNSHTLRRLEAFQDLIREFVINNEFSHKELNNIVRNVLIEESLSLPPQKILVNNAYGVFSLSSAFLHTFGASSMTESRKTLLNKIDTFGDIMSKKYPEVFHLCYMYCMYDFPQIMHVYKEYSTLANHIKSLERWYPFLTADVSLLSKKVWTKERNFLFYAPSKDILKIIQGYDVASIEIHLQECVKKKSKQIECLLEPLCDSHVSIIKRIHTAQNIDGSHLHSNDTYLLDIMEFQDVIKKYGVTNDNIWKYQGVFNIYAMQFLSLTKKSNSKNLEQDMETSPACVYDFLSSHPKYIDTTAQLYDHVIQQVGLLFSSGKNCVLSIEQVPALLGWKMKQSNGKETIEYM